MFVLMGSDNPVFQVNHISKYLWGYRKGFCGAPGLRSQPIKDFFYEITSEVFSVTWVLHFKLVRKVREAFQDNLESFMNW